MSVPVHTVPAMSKTRTVHACGTCGQQLAQWMGRCPGCGEWGTIHVTASTAIGGDGGAPSPVALLGEAALAERRISTGLPGLDRALGGGLVPASVVLLAGEPGIGKSTLLLQVLAHLTREGLGCLLVSGEESHAQVASRARRLGVDADAVTFTLSRELGQVLSAARTTAPFLLAVDSIQTIRDGSDGQLPGGVSQVRTCADALVGLAKAHGIAVLLTGHVTKEGQLAGPRTLEHVVDTVLTFDGDARTGMRVLAGGKNRFGPEGETAWFEMGEAGLREIDPSGMLVSGQHVPGAATALPRAGRRALAVEVQALIGSPDGPPRRQTTGLDARRFQLVAAVLDRIAGGLRLGRAELYGASSGGMRLDDPACDLAIAAALASAATGIPTPTGSAFVGEISLTGQVRQATAIEQRLSAARAGGCTSVFAAATPLSRSQGIGVLCVPHVADALTWAFPRAAGTARDRSA